MLTLDKKRNINLRTVLRARGEQVLRQNSFPKALDAVLLTIAVVVESRAGSIYSYKVLYYSDAKIF